jgi:hypothetical protein
LVKKPQGILGVNVVFISSFIDFEKIELKLFRLLATTFSPLESTFSPLESTFSISFSKLGLTLLAI